jgi:hypothetical protein
MLHVNTLYSAYITNAAGSAKGWNCITNAAD